MVAGQALGGSTALVAAESDSRVKGLLTMDAMLGPLSQSLTVENAQPKDFIESEKQPKDRKLVANFLGSGDLHSQVFDITMRRNSVNYDVRNVELKGAAEYHQDDLYLQTPLKFEGWFGLPRGDRYELYQA